jgi:hypothetical protein
MHLIGTPIAYLLVHIYNYSDRLNRNLYTFFVRRVLGRVAIVALVQLSNMGTVVTHENLPFITELLRRLLDIIAAIVLQFAFRYSMGHRVYTRYLMRGIFGNVVKGLSEQSKYAILGIGGSLVIILFLHINFSKLGNAGMSRNLQLLQSRYLSE